MNGPIRSGNGWRMTLPPKGEPLVSIWAMTPDDAETTAHQENMRSMRLLEEERVEKEREQARLAAEFAKHAVAEFLKIRARA